MNFLNEIFKTRAHSPLLIGERVYTYEDVWEKALRAASRYKKRGIKNKDHIGLLMEHSEESIFSLLGLLIIGATPALISPKSSFEERIHFSQTAGLKSIISPEAPKDETISPPETFDTGIIIFTSGSTGLPKALELDLENLYYSAKGSVKFYSINAKDKYLLNLPLNHVGGLMVFIRCLLSGAQCILSQGDSIKKHRPSLYSLVPTQLIRLLKDDESTQILKEAKAIIVGGDLLPEKYFQKDFPISLTYGLSESTAQVAASKPGTKEMKILPYREVITSDDNIIGIKGKTLFQNYLVDGEKSIHSTVYWTKDKGVLKKDTLEVLGRIDDCFICGGENIMPGEIERALLKIKGVERAKVVPLKNDEYGQIPVAFYKADKNIEDLNDQLKSFLPVYKLPKYSFSLDSNEMKWPKKRLIELAEENLVKH
jgi:O-succinylbenzoic acid--CoA ligase